MNRATLSLMLLGTLLGTACATRDPVADAHVKAAAAPLSASVQAESGLSDDDFSAWLSAERSRIGSERNAAHQRFQEAELSCWRRFAVNDCLSDAKVERRTSLDVLRREELAVNQQERERLTADRLRQLDEKQSEAQSKAADAATKAASEAKPAAK